MQKSYDWQELAACLTANINLFFPDVETHDTNPAPYAYAQVICAKCPVKMDCLEYQMDYERDKRYRFGMFGGLTPSQRHDIAAVWEYK